MSADNWATCPKCLNKDKNDLDKKRKELDDQYGKIDKNKWLQKLEKLNKEEKDRGDNSSLREDYKMGITNEGEFYIGYSGVCSVCDFKYTYNFDKQLCLE